MRPDLRRECSELGCFCLGSWKSEYFSQVVRFFVYIHNGVSAIVIVDTILV